MMKIIKSSKSHQGEGTLKVRDWKMRDQYAGVENAGLENVGNDIVWNTV